MIPVVRFAAPKELRAALVTSGVRGIEAHARSGLLLKGARL